MKLERFDVAPKPEGAWVNLSFSTPAPCTPELMAELAVRLDAFLMRADLFGNVTVNWDGVVEVPGAVDTPAESAVEIAPAAQVAEPDETKPATRRTRTRTPAAEPAPVAEIAPVTRRTRTPAPVAEPVISDLDLAKAASETAAIVGVDAVKGIIAEMGVTTVNQIEGFKKREHFLELLKAERGIVEDANAAA